jgi:hypothetical protein
MLLPFVQLELPGLIGLPEGRYLAREGDAERVLVVQASAVPRPGGRRRRARPVEPSEPTEVPLTRIIVTGTERFDERREALEWLDATVADTDERVALVRSATRLLNRALNALRAAARDPLVQDVGATRALAVRIGFGEGEEIAEGRWSEARQLPPPRRGRLDDVDPQTRVAAVLAGREEVHPAETLLQRARLDLEQGRVDEAVYGLSAASTALDDLPGPRNEKLREQIREVERRLGDNLDR